MPLHPPATDDLPQQRIADDDDESVDRCTATFAGLRCVRDAGHSGKHHAEFGEGEPCATNA